MPPHRLRRAVAVAAAAVGAGVVAAVGVATEPAASAVVQGTAAADSAQAPAGTARAADFSAVYARRRSGVVIDDGGRILTNEHG